MRRESRLRTTMFHVKRRRAPSSSGEPASRLHRAAATYQAVGGRQTVRKLDDRASFIRQGAGVPWNALHIPAAHYGRIPGRPGLRSPYVSRETLPRANLRSSAGEFATPFASRGAGRRAGNGRPIERALGDRASLARRADGGSSGIRSCILDACGIRRTPFDDRAGIIPVSRETSRRAAQTSQAREFATLH